MSEKRWRSTTVLAVRKNGEVTMAADGQVTLGSTIMKSNAKKIRRIFDDKILIGFAGSTADAFNLFDKFEEKVNEYRGDIVRASVELAKDWRTDKILRKLEAMLIIADKNTTLIVSGSGDVVEPDFDVAAIGSGGNFALSAARAYLDDSRYSAHEIAEKSLKIAADVCIYTNNSITIEDIK
ncbi:MAG: HslU--HslV peptidase proteolytic subunit [Spirochaetes bacterium GWF1_31_7]|nr:MAG: HslU--HslV peptidase proteolytic subunit [Spirochaetes bacterium GWE1_32_154]OHD48358.1 MAG: HslU--HslV peptidase proteolytic subunit [Spirochaetes bacterium GWF1_31_7]OHD50451.1 MAG: HslU--HslV peptidase proteolytic subunit [Spirochaetes bacterium GWE2_31_10]OHD81901.1 MAG: HslU--HslV peptidase proteolytic subunit [Spirochaetes bacterium RIFOXYB1_FULL_32_8]HBD96361.1 HslU--HslV peptidase proteolytic subunit [Spirochaetia bacterium]